MASSPFLLAVGGCGCNNCSKGMPIQFGNSTPAAPNPTCTVCPSLLGPTGTATASTGGAGTMYFAAGGYPGWISNPIGLDGQTILTYNLVAATDTVPAHYECTQTTGSVSLRYAVQCSGTNLAVYCISPGASSTTPLASDNSVGCGPPAWAGWNVPKATTHYVATPSGNVSSNCTDTGLEITADFPDLVVPLGGGNSTSFSLPSVSITIPFNPTVTADPSCCICIKGGTDTVLTLTDAASPPNLLPFYGQSKIQLFWTAPADRPTWFTDNGKYNAFSVCIKDPTNVDIDSYIFGLIYSTDDDCWHPVMFVFAPIGDNPTNTTCAGDSSHQPTVFPIGTYVYSKCAQLNGPASAGYIATVPGLVNAGVTNALISFTDVDRCPVCETCTPCQIPGVDLWLTLPQDDILFPDGGQVKLTYANQAWATGPLNFTNTVTNPDGSHSTKHTTSSFTFSCNNVYDWEGDVISTGIWLDWLLTDTDGQFGTAGKVWEECWGTGQLQDGVTDCEKITSFTCVPFHLEMVSTSPAFTNSGSTFQVDDTTSTVCGITFEVINYCGMVYGTGYLLEGAKVTATQVDGSVSDYGYTDQGGKVKLGIGYGKYAIDVQADGCFWCARTVTISNPGPIPLTVYCTTPTLKITGAKSGILTCPPADPTMNITVKQGTTTLGSGSTPLTVNPDICQPQTFTVSWAADGCWTAGSTTVTGGVGGVGFNWCYLNGFGVGQGLKPLYVTDSNGTWPIVWYSYGWGWGLMGYGYWIANAQATGKPWLDPTNPTTIDKTVYCVNDCSKVWFTNCSCPSLWMNSYWCAPIATLATKTSPNTTTGPVNYQYQFMSGIDPTTGAYTGLVASVSYSYQVALTWDFLLTGGYCTAGPDWPCNSCQRAGCEAGPTLTWIPYGNPYNPSCKIDPNDIPDPNYLCTAGYNPSYWNGGGSATSDCPISLPLQLTLEPPPQYQGYKMSWNGDGSCQEYLPDPPGGKTITIDCNGP